MFKRIYIEITNVCNLSCSFCPGTDRKKRFLTPEEFKTVADRIRSYTDYIYLHLMGEPLLHPDLGKILDIASEAGFKINITTNGTLLKKQRELLLACPSIRKVSVSLHSFEGNPGSSVFPGLTDYLEEVYSFCEQASCIVALRLWNAGGAELLNDRIFNFLSEKLGTDVKSLPSDANGRRLGGRLYLENAEKFDWPDASGQDCHVKFCHGLSEQLGILCDGTVVPCCLDAEGAVALGSIYEKPLGDILASSRAITLRQSFIDHKPSEALCRSCGYATRF